ncbi:hypothetical protein CRUP_032997, partial [Coryphaenoides rupestris]
MLRMLGGSLFEFIENLDSLHSYLALSYKIVSPPWRSWKRMGKSEMLVFLVTQAYRGGRWWLLLRWRPTQQGAAAAARKKLSGKKDSLSFSVCRSHWETIRGLVRLGKGKLLRGFEPVYPEHLHIDLKTFCNTFPYHLIFDKQVTFTIPSIHKFINSHFVLQTSREMMPEAWRERPMLQLRDDLDVLPCEPIRIVSMLNSMYLRFDRLTTVHNVYKVETVGDAYMVVGGVPIPVSSHAERVGNFALGMILAAHEVINPITDTVNTASRMKSHGLPNHIHVSTSVYKALRDKGFVLQERGEIEVKGKGRMTTYFLQRNLGASEQDIMGLSGPGAESPQPHSCVASDPRRLQGPRSGP